MTQFATPETVAALKAKVANLVLTGAPRESLENAGVFNFSRQYMNTVAAVFAKETGLPPCRRGLNEVLNAIAREAYERIVEQDGDARFFDPADCGP